MNFDHWSVRLHSACSTIAWCCSLNALWIVFTTLGGFILGIGPATVTACILARRQLRGESFHLRDFARVWRQEFWRGTAVVTPALLAVGILLTNYTFFSSRGPEESAFRLVTLGALILAIAVCAHLGPLYAHYQLPLRLYIVKASRFALARPLSTVLLLFVLVALAFASATWPILLFTVSIGAWLHTSTWLCVRFFEENDNRLTSTDPTGPPPLGRPLPTEPLRIR